MAINQNVRSKGAKLSKASMLANVFSKSVIWAVYT